MYFSLTFLFESEQSFKSTSSRPAFAIRAEHLDCRPYGPSDDEAQATRQTIDHHRKGLHKTCGSSFVMHINAYAEVPRQR